MKLLPLIFFKATVKHIQNTLEGKVNLKNSHKHYTLDITNESLDDYSFFGIY